MGAEVSEQGDRELDFHPSLGMRWEITQSPTDNSGELFELTAWLDPHLPAPPPHVHPNFEESFQVLEGTLDVCKDGAWTTLRPGETESVPAGVPHTLRNSSDEMVKVVGRMQPAGRAEEFFRHIASLIRDGKIKGPQDLRSGIYFAMLADSYPDVSRPTGPVKVAFKPLALIGKALRFKL